jgi:chemotaxis protein methyltransferase CheR
MSSSTSSTPSRRNKTDFFREPQHFEFLKREIVPSLLANRRPTGGHLLKLWSAAASAGAEAYSIAMQLNDLVNTVGSFRFAILGTDISTEVLAQARRAVYPEEMIQPIRLDMQMRYLMRPPRGVRPVRSPHCAGAARVMSVYPAQSHGYAISVRP